ncbi:MAG TPA: MlaD family protein, partial [Rhodocyclaceae bacterium]|nr:MlaD family protein [Rhodocyclaceae bacterium]
MSDVTPEPQQSSPSPAVPMAFVERRRRWRPSVVWLIPVIAALVGGWLAIKAVINQGPTITISFNSAEGLEAGQTEIKFKDVDIGTIKSVRLSRDRTKVIVTAEVTKQAESLMVDDTKFWIVKPRIVGSGVSGLTTLLSGAYVALAVGKSSQERRDFVGLEEPPVVTDGPGRTFTIKANDLGSVGYGTPVYFRRIEAGEVVAYHLDKDGQGVSIEVFIHAPYDKYVTEDTRFWSASGFDISLGATGVKVNAESLAAVILGGLAFGTPPEVVNSTPARVDSTFTLFPSREEALKRQDSRVENYVLVFRESVHGLAV